MPFVDRMGIGHAIPGCCKFVIHINSNMFNMIAVRVSFLPQTDPNKNLTPNLYNPPMRSIPDCFFLCTMHDTFP
jgi:hypothetical protein